MYTFYRRTGASYILFFLLFISWSMSSCLSVKKVRYFNDVPDTTSAARPLTVTHSVKYTDPVIQTNDLLAITIQTLAQNESNTPISSSSTGVFNALNGFLVDKNGNIELALIGFVHVAGLTTSEARELVKERAKEFYKQPVANLRIANFDISFMGEFNHLGPMSFPAEKVNIVQAIAAAGDLTIAGRRSDILLIRTQNDETKFVRFNMLSTDIYHSEYFYLRQRDILYAVPTRNKIQASDNTILRNIGLVSTFISFATLILAFSRSNLK